MAYFLHRYAQNREAVIFSLKKSDENRINNIKHILSIYTWVPGLGYIVIAASASMANAGPLLFHRPAPPNWKITDRPGFKTVFLSKNTIFDESGAVCSAEALTFQGGPA